MNFCKFMNNRADSKVMADKNASFFVSFAKCG